MTQHVTGSTRSEGYSLVLIITRGDVNLVYDVKALTDHFSDLYIYILQTRSFNGTLFLKYTSCTDQVSF